VRSTWNPHSIFPLAWRLPLQGKLALLTGSTAAGKNITVNPLNLPTEHAILWPLHAAFPPELRNRNNITYARQVLQTSNHEIQQDIILGLGSSQQDGRARVSDVPTVWSVQEQGARDTGVHLEKGHV